MQIYSHSLIKTLLFSVLLLPGMYSITYVSDAIADNHRHKDKYFDQRIFSNSEHGKGDKGNEFTGVSAAWIFAVANLPVLLSLLGKGLIRFTFLAENKKDCLMRFNQAQKRYLMPFHYVLNLLALLLAFIHFSLSQCRSSSLPELGLAVMALLTIGGMLIKFKVTPKGLRRAAYQIHTHPLSVALLMVTLLIGHSIVD